MFTYLYIYTHIYIWFCVACPIGCLKKAASRSSQPRELDIRSLTALAFVSSMSEPLRIKTCCSRVGVHHTAATSSNDHSGMMLPSLYAKSHFLSRFVMVRLSWHNKHGHVAQRVGSTDEASHPTERRCSSGKDEEAVPENGFKKWRMNNVPVTSEE